MTPDTVQEHAAGAPGRDVARPRPTAVLGVDVGGTGIKARLVDDDGSLLAEHRVPTPTADPDAMALGDVVAGLVDRATSDATGHGRHLVAVGLVVPGVVDDDAGRVELAVNLGWRAVPVLDRVRDAVADPTLPIAFGQDVRAGALAEARALSGSHTPIAAHAPDGRTIAFVPVGTGLASALVVDGRTLASGGWAGEIGQLRIPHGPHAGRRVEEIASAGAVARRAGASDARAVADRVRTGDPAAAAVWDDCVAVLADALSWLTAVSGCDTVVVGGGLAESGPLLLDPLDRALRDRLADLRPPRLLPARYGDAAGSIGAAIMARELVPAGRTTSTAVPA